MRLINVYVVSDLTVCTLANQTGTSSSSKKVGSEKIIAKCFRNTHHAKCQDYYMGASGGHIIGRFTASSSEVIVSRPLDWSVIALIFLHSNNDNNELYTAFFKSLDNSLNSGYLGPPF